jgi:hypothetical protein
MSSWPYYYGGGREDDGVDVHPCESAKRYAMTCAVLVTQRTLRCSRVNRSTYLEQSCVSPCTVVGVVLVGR